MPEHCSAGTARPVNEVETAWHGFGCDGSSLRTSTVGDVHSMTTNPHLEEATWIDLEEIVSNLTGTPEKIEQVASS